MESFITIKIVFMHSENIRHPNGKIQRQFRHVANSNRFFVFGRNGKLINKISRNNRRQH